MYLFPEDLDGQAQSFPIIQDGVATAPGVVRRRFYFGCKSFLTIDH